MRLPLYLTSVVDRMNLEENVETFLKQNPPFKKKLLLGFSGGGDSLCLAHCLHKLGVDFELAHFDHGWRESSRKEVEDLKLWAKEREIPFHTRTTKARALSELAAREERYVFFEDVFAEGSYMALVLAHHRLDQAETVLKRVFESPRLTSMKGMQSVTFRKGMPIWRPLLKTPKSAIQSYINAYQLRPIEDETNLSPKYLRGRMRTSLFPMLSKEYGKEIEGPLCRLGDAAAKLEKYLDERIDGLVEIMGPFGSMWDLKSAHPFEVEYLLASLSANKGVVLSYHLINEILSALKEGKTNHRVSVADQTLIIDRMRLFWLTTNIPSFPEKVLTPNGEAQVGKWVWKVSSTPKGLRNEKGGWEQWWKGKISVTVREGVFSFHQNRGEFLKLSNSCKVPAFLRPSLPVLVEGEKPVKHFLTGELQAGGNVGGLCRTITLELKMEV